MQFRAVTIECHSAPVQLPGAVLVRTWPVLPVPETGAIHLLSLPLLWSICLCPAGKKKATGIFINKPGHFPACLMSLREKGAAVFTLLGLFCNKNLARICRKSCGGGSDRYFRQSLVKLAAEFCV